MRHVGLSSLLAILLPLAVADNCHDWRETSEPLVWEITEDSYNDHDDALAVPIARGGSIHQLTHESPGFLVGDGGELCLWYELRHEGPGTEEQPVAVEMLTPCTSDPRFDVTLDLSMGFASGSVELDLYCPGGILCRPGETSEGTVRGSFGPTTIGLQPEDPPISYPFPAHHYAPNTYDWSAATPIRLSLTAVGSYPRGDDIVAVDAAATERGWVTVDLVPVDSYGPDRDPTRWAVFVSVLLDHGDTRNPIWDLYAGFSIEIEESGVSPPPRR